MVVDLVGVVEIRPPDVAPVRARVGDLVYPGERLSVPENSSVVLAILRVGTREEVKPVREATVTPEGCAPPDAVARRKEHTKPIAATLKGLRAVSDDSRKAGVGFRSGPEEPPAITPIFGATLANDRPAFTWPPVEGATTYRIKLLSGAGRELWRAETKEARSAFPEGKEPLQRGYVFRWEVTDQDFRPLASGEFSVATDSELKQLDELKALADSGDRADLLATALAYRRLGAYAEAIAIYERLAKQSPDETAYREALSELYRLAGRPKGS
jgi:hypothetical protein